MGEAANLTGIWQGLYSYPHALAPVAFTATLLDSGWLSGSIHEIAVGEDYVPVQVFATILGRHEGGAVQFTKTYDGSKADWSHAVHYAGALSEDATEIQGQWSIPGVWSGKFLMIRPGGPRATVLREAFETV
ncbi:hypothetical protein OVA11_17625 [Caulobacter sp. SL161]|uniref:hypothetical protein n=1 Tax=Caulobacter sp. SL161 TaxID=2995156 RepID=UPI0022747124|nr:hypothetical protein [Caulobacter sp. SL161]MCY1648810.1 hypothetical protein [Caulobacter sp. SL161]